MRYDNTKSLTENAMAGVDITEPYEKKERYVGLFGEWAAKDTNEDRREDIEFELRDLYYELAADYGDVKPSKLYDILSEEITK